MSAGKTLLLLLSAAALCRPSVRAGEAHPDRNRLIVVVYPQNSDGSPGNFEVDQAIRKTIAAKSPVPVEIYNEYLDVALPGRENVLPLQKDYLKQKYAGRHVDLVIAGLSSALDFVLENRDIFPNAPVVFCAVDEREIQSRTLPPDVIGIPCRFELEETLNLARTLHPDLEHVVVVAGKGKMDLEWAERAKTIFGPYQGRLKFTSLTGLSLEDLERKVANLPARSMIYYLHVFQDGAGKALIPATVLESLAAHANAPIYSHVNTYVGRGIVGGRVFLFSKEGENTANIGLRILAGETPESIGIGDASASVDLFDARELERWEIDPALLPSGSIIEFQDPSFWERFKWHILGVCLLLFLQAALIFGLLFQRVHLKSAENRSRQAILDLETSESQLRQLSNRLIEAQEQERRRVARELHDDFSQSLALLAVRLDMLRQHFPKTNAESEAKFEELTAQVRELSSALHELSHELHPLKLEQLGLETSVRSLCQEISANHSLRIQFVSRSLPRGIPSETALCLYRIVQESLRNVLKHSRAQEATIDMTAESGRISLMVKDGGVGFDTTLLGSQEGLGFISMRERLRLIDGEIEIASAPAQGTKIQVRVPLTLSEITNNSHI
jgi:signal transduction histidine kinase